MALNGTLEAVPLLPFQTAYRPLTHHVGPQKANIPRTDSRLHCSMCAARAGFPWGGRKEVRCC